MNRCHSCGKREATIHLTEITNGEKQHTSLCNSCAVNRGFHNSFYDGVKVVADGDEALVFPLGSSDIETRVHIFDPEDFELDAKEIKSKTSDPNSTPPIRAEFILNLFLPKDDRMTMVGDLAEEYQTYILPKYGKKTAGFWYWTQVVKSLISAQPLRLGWLLKLADVLIKKLV